MPASKIPLGVTKSLGNSLRPYIAQHSRSFDFTPFAPVGNEFVIEFARAFARRAGGVRPATAAHDFYAIRKLLTWIQSNSKSFPAFRHKLSTDYKSIEVDEWEQVLDTWRDDLVNGEHRQRESSRAGIIRTVNTLIGVLESTRIIKPIFRLKPIKNANKKVRPKKCLGEVSPLNTTTETLPTDDSPSQLRRSRRHEAPFETPSQRVHPADSIARANEKWLTEIRRCAETELTYWIAHFKEGQRLLNACDMKFSEIRKQLQATEHNRGARARLLPTLFPRGSRDIALSRCLTYILYEYGGVTPAAPHLRGFFSRFCRSRGVALDHLRAYLIPHPHATLAVQLIFLIDTGANISVCYSLDRNCLSDSDTKGHKQIAGFKDRAGGKLILSELPVKDRRFTISCVQALESYREMSKHLAKTAPNGVSNSLFLHVCRKGERSAIRPLNKNLAQEEFPAFLSRHEELKELKITLDMIRSTVLFQTIHENKGNLVFANALGNHASLSTTAHYANRFSLHLVYEELTREFQSLFQVVSTSKINGAAQKLNIDSLEFDRVLKNAHRTGLGVACLNPRSGYQPESVKGKKCVSLQNCPRCPLRFVVATVSNLTDLILFHKHLEMSRREFEATRPARWLEVWLPWLIFAEVALEKAQRGRTAATYLEAKRNADARMASGSVNFPPLW